MAQSAIVSLTETWTNVLSGLATNVAFQVRRNGPVEVKGTASGTPPTASEAGMFYNLGQGELSGALTRFGTGTTHLYMRAMPENGDAVASVFVVDDA